jgi:hypothetical protein
MLVVESVFLVILQLWSCNLHSIGLLRENSFVSKMNGTGLKGFFGKSPAGLLQEFPFPHLGSKMAAGIK